MDLPSIDGRAFRRRGRPLAAALLALFLLLWPGCRSLAPHPAGTLVAPPAFVRGSWVVRTDLVSPASVDRLLAEARQAHLNSLFVQVRGRGDAYYQSRLEPPPPALQGSGFDPLGRLLPEAHRLGIRIHAWINVCLVGDPDHPNADPRHILNAHPEWLSWPRALAARVESRSWSPQHARARLRSFVKAHRRSVEGFYGEASLPAYRKHVVLLVEELLTRYPVDGLHLDFIRYPNTRWGYSQAALARFRQLSQQQLSPGEQRRLARLAVDDPLLYARRFPTRWNAFRKEGVDRLVSSLYEVARRVRPHLELSAAVFPVARDALAEHFQDWPLWLLSGWLDRVSPMNYTSDRALFEARTEALLALAPRERVWLGIGAWRLPLAETVHRMRYARGLGLGGALLFSQGSLRQLSGGFQGLGREAREKRPLGRFF